ncbi:hypothetical protein CNY89_08975 [Amaricoccus sp. HAR-UPW-R2A-40]|nr:hypothetical protein CNY89_08975 [Amaricoccus sp. HAR-UPW-R2A-40]
MSLLSRLFGGSSAPAAPEAEPVVHDGFRIFPEPMKEAGGYRIAARIEKEIDGVVKSHRMIRADTCGSADEAREVTTNKAKSLIDQQGEAIFAA